MSASTDEEFNHNINLTKQKILHNILYVKYENNILHRMMDEQYQHL